MSSLRVDLHVGIPLKASSRQAEAGRSLDMDQHWKQRKPKTLAVHLFTFSGVQVTKLVTGVQILMTSNG